MSETRSNSVLWLHGRVVATVLIWPDGCAELTICADHDGEKDARSWLRAMKRANDAWRREHAAKATKPKASRKR